MVAATIRPDAAPNLRIKTYVDTAASCSTAANDELLENLRHGTKIFTLGDNKTKRPAGSEGDVAVNFGGCADNDTVITFHCLTTGSMWLLSVNDLCSDGHAVWLFNDGPSFGITPDHSVYVIERETPNINGGGTGLWHVYLEFSKAGTARIVAMDKNKSTEVLNKTLLELISDGSSTILIAPTRAADGIEPTVITPSGRLGHMDLDIAHAALAHPGKRVSEAIARLNAPGLPREFCRKDKSRAIIVCGSECYGCRVTRRDIPHSSPMASRVIMIWPRLGLVWFCDFTRIMPTADFEGNTLAICFFEANTSFAVVELLKTHDDFFAAATRLVQKVKRDHGLTITTISLDSDSTVFKPGNKDPFTAKATAWQAANPGTTFRASDQDSQSMNIAENGMNPLQAIMYAQVAYARFSMLWWGRSIDHGGNTIMNVRPRANTSLPMLQHGAYPWRAYYGVDYDFSMLFPFGSGVKCKIVDAKSNQLSRLYREGAWVGVSENKLSWKAIIYEDLKLHTTWHMRIDTNMDRRSTLLYKHDNLAMGTSEGTKSGIHQPTNEFNNMLRGLFADLKETNGTGIVVFSPLT